MENTSESTTSELETEFFQLKKKQKIQHYSLKALSLSQEIVNTNNNQQKKTIKSN